MAKTKSKHEETCPVRDKTLHNVTVVKYNFPPGIDRFCKQLQCVIIFRFTVFIFYMCYNVGSMGLLLQNLSVEPVLGMVEATKSKIQK